MIAAAQWLKIWVFSMEVSGLNAGKFSFPKFSHAPFYPTVTVLLEYFDSTVYSLVFAL